MPDDRLIHKAFGQSEKVSRLTDFERLVWLVYKVAADDFGVMRFSAITLQDGARFLEQRPAKQVMRALESVRDVALILTFEHQDRTYCFDPVWQTWQKITHPRQTKQPIPPADRCDLNTQFLLTYHPTGGKLSSWQHPSLRPKKGGSPPEVLPVQTGSAHGVDRESSRLLVVDVGNGGVGVGVRGSGEGAAPRHPRALQTGGVMAGTLPRDHLNCRQPCVRICLSEKQHAILKARHGGDDAALDAFYADVRAKLSPDVPIGDTPWKFWDAQFAAKFGTATTVPNHRTAGNAAAISRFIARGHE
jgi:hypothetical protein